MRYLRHPPLLFWLVFVVAGAVVVVAATVVGPGRLPRQNSPAGQEPTVFALQDRLAQLPELSRSPAPVVAAWATRTARMADTAAAAAGRDRADAGLQHAYLTLGGDCTTLAVDAGGPKATADMLHIYRDGDVLAALVTPAAGEVPAPAAQP